MTGGRTALAPDSATSEAGARAAAVMRQLRDVGYQTTVISSGEWGVTFDVAQADGIYLYTSTISCRTGG